MTTGISGRGQEMRRATGGRRAATRSLHAIAAAALFALCGCFGDDETPFTPEPPPAEIQARILLDIGDAVFTAEIAGADGIPSVRLNDVPVLSTFVANPISPFQDPVPKFSYEITIPMVAPGVADLEVSYWPIGGTEMRVATASVSLPNEVAGETSDAFVIGEDAVLTWPAPQGADWYWVRFNMLLGYYMDGSLIHHSVPGPNYPMEPRETADTFLEFSAAELWPPWHAEIDSLATTSLSVRIVTFSGPRDGDPGNIEGQGVGAFRIQSDGGYVHVPIEMPSGKSHPALLGGRPR